MSPSEESSGEPGASSGDVRRLRTFTDASQDGVTCGGYRAVTPHGHRRQPEDGVACGGYRETVSLGHRVLGPPCRHQHVMHAWRVMETVARGGAQAPFLCGAHGCVRPAMGSGQHKMRQFRPTLDSSWRPLDPQGGPAMTRMGTAKRSANCYSTLPKTKVVLVIAGPLADVSLNSSNSASPPLTMSSRGWQSPTPRCLSTCSTSSTTPWERIYSTGRPSKTPHSLLRAIKLPYILPTLQHTRGTVGRIGARDLVPLNALTSTFCSCG